MFTRIKAISHLYSNDMYEVFRTGTRSCVWHEQPGSLNLATTESHTMSSDQRAVSIKHTFPLAIFSFFSTVLTGRSEKPAHLPIVY